MFEHQLKNFGVYLDGIGYLGTATEVQLPKITIKTEEWLGAGMTAPVEVDTGKTEKLEASVKYKGLQIKTAKGIGQSIPLIIRASLANSEGADVKATIEMRGLIKELDFSPLSPDNLGETNLSMSLNYYRFAVDGEDFVEIDPINGVRKINGDNQLANIIANITG